MHSNPVRQPLPPIFRPEILRQVSMFCMQRAKALKRYYICAGLTKPSLFAYPHIGILNALLIPKHKKN